MANQTREDKAREGLLLKRMEEKDISDEEYSALNNEIDMGSKKQKAH